MLVAGGGQYTATAELYDPATNRWTSTGSMHIGRVGATGTLLRDGRVLVVGGNSFQGVQASAELFDPATARWALTGNLHTPSWVHTATRLQDGTVLVAGGLGLNGYPRNAELYNPSVVVIASMNAASGPASFPAGCRRVESQRNNGRLRDLLSSRRSRRSAAAAGRLRDGAQGRADLGSRRAAGHNRYMRRSRP